MSFVATGKEVLLKQATTLEKLAASLGQPFDDALELLEQCKGKVILTGMGKSGIICRKIAATLSSTGTPAFFLHPAEGAHGDLGVLSHDDVMLAVSNSGETEELLGLLPLVRRMKLKLICMTGCAESTLARRADVILLVAIADEGCPLNLAPMASTTATLALGDALAASLMKLRGVSEEDFALVHPAGSLGKKLTLLVEDMMVGSEGVPRSSKEDLMSDVICEISGKGLGFVGIFDADGALVGSITDGDLRRLLQQPGDFLAKKAREVMHTEPKTIPMDTLAADALRLMENHSITSLFVTDGDDLVCGVVHIHHLVKAGLG